MSPNEACTRCQGGVGTTQYAQGVWSPLGAIAASIALRSISPILPRSAFAALTPWLESVRLRLPLCLRLTISAG